MADIVFKKNPQGFADLRYSDQARAILEGIGAVVADAANSSMHYNGPDDLEPGFEVRSAPGKPDGTLGRWRVSVTAATPHAIRHNAIHNTLLRALGGGQA